MIKFLQNNKLFNYFFNEYDFIFRFFYTRVFGFRKILHYLTSNLYNSDYKEIDNTFAEIKQLFAKQKIDLKNKQILEIGPGNSVMLALNCLASGSKNYIMADKYNRFKNPAFIEEQINYFLKKHKLSDSINVENLILFNSGSLTYVQEGIENLSSISSNSIDIIFSVSVLEHVQHIKEAFKELRRVLKPYGYMYHTIDLRDHYNFKQPLKFLKYSDFIWNNFLTKEGYSYTNRLRIDDFKELFAENNFKILYLEKSQYQPLGINKKFLAKKFQQKDISSLSTLSVKVLLQKEG